LRPPHRFPFELVDRAADGAGVLGVTAGSWWLRGETPLTLPWLVEAAAQAAARLLELPAGESARLALAGIDQAVLTRPVEAGERVELRVRLAGRWGALVRIDGELWADGLEIGRLSLTLAASPLAETAGR
jgi:3-hydroxymyristoyl/3-hydroxydecanoyl-(acyl carrier protein) dehydratase